MNKKKTLTYKYIAILIFIIIHLGCDDPILIKRKQPSILMLQVDYSTSTFEGGFEFEYDQSTKPFDYLIDYRQPDDFGSVKVFHVGLEDLLFEGSIVWAGIGERIEPEILVEANNFGISQDELNPELITGFEEIFNPGDQDFEVEPAWNSLADLQIVQDYLAENQQEIHYFLYQPSVGPGNPEDWDWIFFLHK